MYLIFGFVLDPMEDLRFLGLRLYYLIVPVTMSSMTMVDGGCDDLLGDRMDRWGWRVDNLSLESVDRISNIVDSSEDAIRLQKRVRSFYHTSVSGLMS
jgi:hypothetical protein